MRGGGSSFQNFPKIRSWNFYRAPTFSCLCLLPNCRNFKHFKHSDLRHQILKPYRHLKLSPPPPHGINDTSLVTSNLGTGRKVSEREHIFWKSIFFYLAPSGNFDAEICNAPFLAIFISSIFCDCGASFFNAPSLIFFVVENSPFTPHSHTLWPVP